MTEDTTNTEYGQQPRPNPALKDLERFVGDWNMEVSRASFLPDPAATLNGYASIEWFEEGAFLVIRQGAKTGPPFSIWLVGRDDSAETYKMLYFDNREVSRIYDMSFDGDVWKIWREAPGFFQRFTGTFSKDGKSIAAQWEKSSDGKSWEHDFDLTYTKGETTWEKS